MVWIIGGCLAVGYLLGWVTAGILASGKRSELEEELNRQVLENFELKECIINAKDRE